MKTALKISSYTLAILMGLGTLIMIGDQSMDLYTFIAATIIITQSVLTLMYIEKKK